MPSTQLIVCEATSKWAVALRRHLRNLGGIRVYETRHLDDCWQQAVANPASLVALEATAQNIEPLAVSMLRYRTRLPRVPVIVLADRCLTEAEWLWREAGAVHVVFSPRHLSSCERLIRCHFDRITRLPTRESSVSWEKLPWGGDWDARSFSRPAWLNDPRE